jgi:hypothetical protein
LQGLHGLQAALAAHGLAAAQGFLAAHGLHAALAAHGLHGLHSAFFAAQGLQAAAAHGFFAAHGLQAAAGLAAAHGLHEATAGCGLTVDTVAMAPAASARAIGRAATLRIMFVLNVFMGLLRVALARAFQHAAHMNNP